MRWNKIWEILVVKFLGVEINNNLNFDEHLGNGLFVKCVRLNKSNICLGRPYLFKFFKDCLLQILLGLYLNTLSHMTFNKFFEKARS